MMLVYLQRASTQIERKQQVPDAVVADSVRL
jgi:hypothetical protein